MVLTHKRRTKLLSSVPYAYSGFFSVTLGILLTTSILYIVFLPGIALGQQQKWLEYVANPHFYIKYPESLGVFEVPNGVQFILEPEIGSEYPSFLFQVTVEPYNGPSQLDFLGRLANPNELASELAYEIGQQNPYAQITYVGPNNAGNLAILEYTDGNFHFVWAGTIHDGKLYVYGYTYAMGPNDALSNTVGMHIVNSMMPKTTSMSSGGMQVAQNLLNNWAISNPGSFEYCQLHQYDDDPSC